MIPLLQKGRVLACVLAGLSIGPSGGLAETPQPQIGRLRSSPVLQHLVPNPAGVAARTGPEQTLAQMYVPPGFRVDLVAGEPEVEQPVAFAFDERGRLWIAEAFSYPTKRPAGQGMDRLIILEDTDGDGRFETRKVFAEGLNLMSGFELGFGGVWVGAAPELLFIPDRNHDDHPDGPPEVLLDGFGYQDTHECLNSFLWGPDGWLYGIQGVFNFARIGKPGAPDSARKELRAGVWRYHPVRHEFEVFAEGGSNPWGLDFDENGELFMTHCRSYWGRGGTTHVMQNGHFWNQANANHAPYIIADPPAALPEFRNYLLASARYDHGAGGAGAQGSDAIYGGHAHVGTMIYLGDNWPDRYRGHLFTHNLHGHQINQQVNRPEGSGYNTVHEGQDHLFCTDPKYVAIDLQYGPDGAVYIIDWYDQQHCHNPNAERWERTSGRVYRMEWEANWHPTRVDLGRMSNTELVNLQTHRNHWYSRTARRLLQERATTGGGVAAIAPQLQALATGEAETSVRLRALWTLHGIGQTSPEILSQVLRDRDAHVRGWGVQLAAERAATIDRLSADFLRLAQQDPSPVVRRYLASAIPRVADATAWGLIEALSQRSEDREDRNLPILLWQGLGQRMRPANLARAFEVATKTQIPLLADWIHWFAATMEGSGLDRVTVLLSRADDVQRRRLLAGANLALEGRANVSMPADWKPVAATLYASADAEIVRGAERLGSALGDDSMRPRLRATLQNRDAAAEARAHAFNVLGRAADRESLPVFLALLAEPGFAARVLPLLARFDTPAVSAALISRFSSLPIAEQSTALNTLTSRVSFANALLDAVAGGTIPRDRLNALHVRQLSQLKHPEVDRRVAAVWGRINASPADQANQIVKLLKTFDEAPLWAFDGTAGRAHFVKLCASCHVHGRDGTRLGPELTGTGRNGIRYFVENIIDPNSVIGTDFQMTTIETRQGEVHLGILVSETPTSVTLRTATEQRTVAKADVAKRELSDKSMMPEGLLSTLNEREQIELLKFLTSN